MVTEPQPNQIELSPYSHSELTFGLYDLSSCGMAVMTRAVHMAHRTPAALTDYELPQLTTDGSNFIVQPFAQDFFKPEDSSFKKPNHCSPLAESHRALYFHMREEYRGLQWLMTKWWLNGNQPDLSTPNSRQPISKNEIDSYLTQALKIGVITGVDTIQARNAFPNEAFRDDPIGNLLKISHLIQLDNDPFHFIRDLFKAGVMTPDSFDEEYYRSAHSPNLATIIREISLYKLGTMLALMQQIAYDFYCSGNPISASLRPIEASEEAEYTENWRILFMTTIPPIKTVIREARATMINFSNPDDPYLKYLFADEADPTKYLVE